ncbi:MAG TPA: hypothetical protein VIH18_09720 [Candidatus Binatia bacterium]
MVVSSVHAHFPFLIENLDVVQKVRDGLNFSCEKKGIAFIFVLPYPKRGKQSVGRDHFGITLVCPIPDSELPINDLIGGLKVAKSERKLGVTHSKAGQEAQAFPVKRIFFFALLLFSHSP